MTGLEDLRLLRAFVRITESGSISAAARVLNVSQPTLSRQLSQLERSAGVSLIRRDTHTMSLTAAGRRLVEDARDLLGMAEAASQRLREEQDTPRGHLRVVAVVDFGQWIVPRLLASFRQRYPLVTAELHLINRPSKFVEEGFDCGVLVGRVTDGSVAVRKIAELSRLLVAAPSLLRERGIPRKPAELKLLPWIGALQPHFYLRDRIQLVRGEEHRMVKLSPVLLLDSVTALREAAIAGAGMTIQPDWLVGDALAGGGLIHLLPEWRVPAVDVQVAYAPGRHLPGRVRAFVDFAATEVPRLIEDLTHPNLRRGARGQEGRRPSVPPFRERSPV
ncbi:MAG: LysR family transcriptional regulator [Verrucomicrobiales bacterium]|nr:LysR family transcriptional regulator [Verrucomicrobiales bacterium]